MPPWAQPPSVRFSSARASSSEPSAHSVPYAPFQVEASSALRGVGLVKLMGRQSGFLAMQVDG